MLGDDGRPLSPFSPGQPLAVRRRLEGLALGGDGRLLAVTAGLATFVFGLLAAAMVNLYLIATNDPVVHQLPTVISYKSAIFGDGLVLPIVNMAAASYVAKQRGQIGKHMVLFALLLGAALTAYVHVMQATNDLVNWSMPMPWHWNGLGAMHALYMFAVVSWLWLFLFVVVKVAQRPTSIPREAGVVLAGVLVFLFLLRLDYRSAELHWVPPAEEAYGARAGSAIASSLEAIGITAR
jgi:hypothetical protein